LIRRTYKYLRKSLSTNNKSVLSKLVYSLSGKPSYKLDRIPNHEKFPSNLKGGLVISADFEMAWAFRYSKRDVNPIEMAKMERENIPLILNVFDRYSIPITWATVGHLFLESCNKNSHQWMRRIPYFNDHWRFAKGDWFDDDPNTNYKLDNSWYAPDLIERILNSKTNHEFGCHTFSHIDCSDKNCPPEVLEDEICACISAASKFGVQFKSFVFPGGTYGNYDVLKKFGFQIYRKKIEKQLAYPYYDQNGLLVTVSTASFGRNLNWEADYYIRIYKKIITKAIKTKSIAHIWFHPSFDKWTLENVIPSVLDYADQLRSDGNLWIGTMGQIASHIHENKVLDGGNCRNS
jgi:peptidoglycan/xylan/chitin deacetylase (PgdA/CDA1 family)